MKPIHLTRWPGIFAIAVTLAPLTAVADDRALVIGINRYEHLEQPLQGAVNDAGRMMRFLVDELGFAPEQIRLLTDEQATDTAILGQIAQWLGAAGPEDRALFYYSGHGLQLPDFDGDETDGYDEALVPTNANVDANGFASGFIADDALQSAFGRLTSRRVTVIVDSCHSGTMTRDALFGVAATARAKSPAEFIRRLATPRSADALVRHRSEDTLLASTDTMVVWTAVSAAQLAFEEAPFGRPPGGIFTSSFIMGMADRTADSNGNDLVSHAELLDYVSAASERWCRNTASCTLGLTPTLEASRDLLVEPVAGAGPQLAENFELIPGIDTPLDPAGTPVFVPPADDILAGPPPVPTLPDQQPGAPLRPPSVEETVPSQEVPPQLAPPPGGTPIPPPAGAPAALAEVATEVLAHDNELGVSLEIVPGPKISVGDTVRFRVTSPGGGFLTLLDINASSELLQLYPNRFAEAQNRGTRIGAGASITVPDAYYGFEFRAAEPIGRGTVLAIVTEDDVDWGDLLERSRDLEVIAEPVDYLLEMAEKLRETWRRDENNRALRWSLAEFGYEIVR